MVGAGVVGVAPLPPRAPHASRVCHPRPCQDTPAISHHPSVSALCPYTELAETAAATSQRQRPSPLWCALLVYTPRGSFRLGPLCTSLVRRPRGGASRPPRAHARPTRPARTHPPTRPPVASSHGRQQRSVAAGICSLTIPLLGPAALGRTDASLLASGVETCIMQSWSRARRRPICSTMFCRARCLMQCVAAAAAPTHARRVMCRACGLMSQQSDSAQRCCGTTKNARVECGTRVARPVRPATGPPLAVVQANVRATLFI